MLAFVRLYICSVLCLTAIAGAQPAPPPPPMPQMPRPARSGHKMRVKIDSAPQQAAVYVDSKQYGIEG